MSTIELNDLLSSLQNTARSTQDKIEAIQQEGLRSIINTDQNGQAESLSLECQLPSGDGKQRRHEFIRLSLARLCSSEKLEVDRISVEFPCKVTRQKFTHSNTHYNHVISPIKNHQNTKDHPHVFMASTFRENNFISEALIDSLPINDYLDKKANTDINHSILKTTTRRRLLFLTFLIFTDLSLLFLSN